ncbi:hypothetical protein HHI36_014936, partial [Cryptolaemus montrouzieri]
IYVVTLPLHRVRQCKILQVQVPKHPGNGKLGRSRRISRRGNCLVEKNYEQNQSAREKCFQLSEEFLNQHLAGMVKSQVSKKKESWYKIFARIHAICSESLFLWTKCIYIHGEIFYFTNKTYPTEHDILDLQSRYP